MFSFFRLFSAAGGLVTNPLACIIHRYVVLFFYCTNSPMPYCSCPHPPGVSPPEALLVDLVHASSLHLSSASCAELSTLVSSLARLRYRPPDAWCQGFLLQAHSRLPAFVNEDYGLTLYGLACLGVPLEQEWLKVRL